MWSPQDLTLGPFLLLVEDLYLTYSIHIHSFNIHHLHMMPRFILIDSIVGITNAGTHARTASVTYILLHL